MSTKHYSASVAWRTWGYECRLGKNGGTLVDVQTGEHIPLHRRGNLYFMKAWVRNDTSNNSGNGFGRQG